MIDLKKCEQCKKSFVSLSPRQRFCTIKCRKENEKTRARENFVKIDQLCWECAKATGGCSWSASFKPIKEWTVTPVHKIDAGRQVDTYCITACPEFMKG